MPFADGGFIMPGACTVILVMDLTVTVDGASKVFHLEIGCERGSAHEGDCRGVIQAAGLEFGVWWPKHGAHVFINDAAVADWDGLVEACGREILEMPKLTLTFENFERARTPEQEARDMLEEAGVANAQEMTAGDLVGIANLIAELRHLRRYGPFHKPSKGDR